jgi:hypothetical protein
MNWLRMAANGSVATENLEVDTDAVAGWFDYIYRPDLLVSKHFFLHASRPVLIHIKELAAPHPYTSQNQL